MPPDGLGTLHFRPKLRGVFKKKSEGRGGMTGFGTPTMQKIGRKRLDGGKRNCQSPNKKNEAEGERKLFKRRRFNKHTKDQGGIGQKM